MRFQLFFHLTHLRGIRFEIFGERLENFVLRGFAISDDRVERFDEEFRFFQLFVDLIERGATHQERGQRFRTFFDFRFEVGDELVEIGLRRAFFGERVQLRGDASGVKLRNGAFERRVFRRFFEEFFELRERFRFGVDLLLNQRQFDAQ